MRPILTENPWRGVAAAALVAGLVALTSGCATSMGELAPPTSAPLVLNSAVAGETVAEVKPAVMVEQVGRPGAPMPVTAPVTAGAEPPPLPKEVATGSTVATAAPADEPKKKLLSPEEKARVIAELEALARSQEAGTPTAKKDCAEGAAMALEPEERLKRDSTPGEC